MSILRTTVTATLAITLAQTASAQIQGPSTASTPYVLPVLPATETISLLTVDNTGGTPDDTVPRISGGTYGMSGIPDGMGAFDNGDGTFTLLMNHEFANTAGSTHDHGAAGAFVSRWIILKNSLFVNGGEDLMKQIYGWNSTTQSNNATPSPFAFNRYCSADLAPVSAYFNSVTGLGTQARIFLNGEEGGNTGWARGHVASGLDIGKSYVLGKFNLSTNGSGLTGVGGWENIVASPFMQDKTVVIGTNDGGTGIMTNSIAVYVGTKTNAGSEVDRAGLSNGTLKFVLVTGNLVEIANSATRATNITNGTTFTLSGTASTTFSRPEDGAWSLSNPNQFYFVTTDQLDQVSDSLGTQVGRTRLWRLNFTDIRNPDLGGTIDLLIDGQTVGGQKVNMFDNLAVHETTGRLLLQEDVGGAAHNGKIWEYDPATFNGTTNSGLLRIVAKHDPARFGDRVGGVTFPATAPFSNDEESSGIIDITSIMRDSTLHQGNYGETWYVSSDQAHYTSGITNAQVEGGQIFVLHQLGVTMQRSGIVRDRRTGTYVQQVTLTNNTIGGLAGPVAVYADNVSANAALANPSGAGGNYVLVPGTESGLAPGASATVTLQFTNQNNQAISYTPRVQPASPIN